MTEFNLTKLTGVPFCRATDGQRCDQFGRGAANSAEEEGVQEGLEGELASMAPLQREVKQTTLLAVGTCARARPEVNHGEGGQS
jgi:hypothetical protein